MSENQNATANADAQNNGGAANATAATNASTDATQNVFDPKTIGDADFEKIYDDPRTFKHPRFKSLAERAKKADEFEAQAKQAEEQKLIETKQFQELAAKRAEELGAIQSKHSQTLQDMQIMQEAAKIGVVDLNAVLKLIDRSRISVAGDTVVGAKEALESLLANSPYLKGKPSNGTGGGTAPGDDNGGSPRFKLSQLQDPRFYKEHEKDIMAAMAKGQVEDDMRK